MGRRLGQHFLHNRGILEQIAAAACGERTSRVVEIGPGKGALTRFLLQRTDELHAVELDPVLAARLPAQLGSPAALTVHQSDVLETDLAQWGPAVLAGNLPYYITSPIIDKFLRLNERFPTAVFLTQWEVAERLLAKPGSRDYGYLTVSAQLICEVELVCKVLPGAFSPPPKVDSAAVRFRRRPAALVANAAAFLQFAGVAFAHKRKTLRNNLRAFAGAAAIEGMPEAGLRAEQLSVPELLNLFRRLTGPDCKAPIH